MRHLRNNSSTRLVLATLTLCLALIPLGVSRGEDLTQIALDRAQKQALVKQATAMIAAHQNMTTDQIIADLRKTINQNAARIHDPKRAQQYVIEATTAVDKLRGHSPEAIVAVERVELQSLMSSGDVFVMTRNVWADGSCQKYMYYGVLCLMVTPVFFALDVVLMPVELFLM